MSESAEMLRAEQPQAGRVAASLVSTVNELHRIAGGLLARPAANAPWPDRIHALGQRLDCLRTGTPDGLLFLLIHGATRLVDRYSSHHALVAAAAAAECAALMGWPEAELRALTLAALTMNVSITDLQDELVHRERTPTLDQRRAIDSHAARSAELLGALGVTDALWLGAVSQHHAVFTAAQRQDGLDAAQRLADLLRRVDIFTARLSPRRARKGLLPTLAVRSAYLGNGSGPDEIGIAMTKAVGIYPPGSFVLLATGETAIVLKRGARPSQPLVACLTGPDGQPLALPLARDTAEPAHAVKSPARADDVRGAAIDTERLLELMLFA